MSETPIYSLADIRDTHAVKESGPLTWTDLLDVK